MDQDQPWSRDALARLPFPVFTMVSSVGEVAVNGVTYRNDELVEVELVCGDLERLRGPVASIRMAIHPGRTRLADAALDQWEHIGTLIPHPVSPQQLMVESRSLDVDGHPRAAELLVGGPLWAARAAVPYQGRSMMEKVVVTVVATGIAPENLHLVALTSATD